MPERKSGSYSIRALSGTVEGLDALLAKLDALPETVLAAAKRAIGKEAAAIADEAASHARGEIEPNIDSQTETEGMLVRGAVYVQPGGYKQGPLWPVYVEMGTGPKGIASGGAKYPLPAEAYTQHAWFYYDDTLKHVVRTEGRYAQPYMWPAYLARRPFILEGVKANVREYLAGLSEGGGSR